VTARKYIALLGVAFVTPGVLLYGGLYLLSSNERIGKWFGDQLFKALREGGQA